MFAATVYRALLALYPVEFQLSFRDEMLAIFQQTALERCPRGSFHYGLFLVRELSSLLIGAARENLADPQAAPNPSNLPLPTDIPSAELQIKLTSALLLHAISHHDFEKARQYDVRDRELRSLLKRFRSCLD